MAHPLRISDALGILDDSIPSILVKEEKYRPRWLLTEYRSLSWVVTDTGEKPNRKIRFDVLLPNGKRLSDYPKLIESIKRVVYGIRTGPLMSAQSGQVQATAAANLIILASWMTSNKIYRFCDLTRHDAKEYLQLARYGTHTILNTEGVLNRYIEKALQQANFDISDSQEVRREKAKSIFPYYLSNGIPILRRPSVLIEAGLDGIASQGIITRMLDELEALCGFYQDPSTRRRLEMGPSMDEVDEEPVTTEHLRRLLLPFEYLYVHRRYLDDCIPHSLFPGSSPSEEANKLGKTIGRTSTVPLKQAVTLIERSVRWVLDYAPTLLAMKDGLVDIPPPPENAPGSPFPILTGYWRAAHYETSDEALQAEALRQGMTLPLALNFLMTACAVVIAAFSARRAAEIIGLKVGCIEHDDMGKPWLRIFIHKTSQGVTAVPVPEVVENAIAILERLSESARVLNGSPYLFQYLHIDSQECRWLSEAGQPVFPFGSFLRKYGYFIDIPTLPDGTRWTFRPHQLRRFFAILYVWIYDLGDWGALSYHLRHFNPEMTRRYCRDDELGYILSHANREHSAQVLTNAALGRTRVAGIEGERFAEAAKRLYDRMAQRVQVVSERKFAQRIMRLVERTGVSLQALPWGFCARRPTEDASSFTCGGTEVPDFGAATISTCLECSHGFRTTSFIPFLKSTLKLHEGITQAKDSPLILRQSSAALSAEIREYIESVEHDAAEGSLS
ncbi:hypothetical protein [Achromobacter insolitus]|uniref:hypothetical protein n=1 Tax=Achromobacter insolitus TaxID=217204 RepID=UPI002FDED300